MCLLKLALSYSHERIAHFCGHSVLVLPVIELHGTTSWDKELTLCKTYGLPLVFVTCFFLVATNLVIFCWEGWLVWMLHVGRPGIFRQSVNFLRLSGIGSFLLVLVMLPNCCGDLCVSDCGGS